jgi:hypothetical protein
MKVELQPDEISLLVRVLEKARTDLMGEYGRVTRIAIDSGKNHPASDYVAAEYNQVCQIQDRLHIAQNYGHIKLAYEDNGA